jgi:hypothetical protein
MSVEASSRRLLGQLLTTLPKRSSSRPYLTSPKALGVVSILTLPGSTIGNEEKNATDRVIRSGDRRWQATYMFLGKQ